MCFTMFSLQFNLSWLEGIWRLMARFRASAEEGAELSPGIAMPGEPLALRKHHSESAFQETGVFSSHPLSRPSLHRNFFYDWQLKWWIQNDNYLEEYTCKYYFRTSNKKRKYMIKRKIFKINIHSSILERLYFLLFHGYSGKKYCHQAT